MALVIEDGTGKSDANAYDSVENVRNYLIDRGKITVSIEGEEPETVTTYNPDITEAMIIQATQNIDNLYESLFSGVRAVDGQALAFPRSDAYMFGQAVADDTVPQRIKNAVAEMCLYSAKGIDSTPIVQTGIKLYRAKVDVIEEETEYSGSGTVNSSGVLTRVVNELKPLFKPSYGSFNGIIRRW